MSDDIHVEIVGLDRLQAALRRAPAVAVDELGKAVQKAAYAVQSSAIKEAPVNKGTGGGNLRQNIVVASVTKLRAIIRSRAPYSIFVEEGTRPHDIEVRTRRVLANKRTGQFFGKKVHHPGTSPNRYMKRAIERSRPLIDSFFKRAIDNILKTIK